MADSTGVGADNENRLRFGCALVARLYTVGILTDVLVAAASNFQDLLDDLVTAFYVSGTTNAKYDSHVYIALQGLQAELKYLESLGIIDNTITAALETANSVDAATDLFYLFQSNIPNDKPGRADQSFLEFSVGAVSYGSGL